MYGSTMGPILVVDDDAPNAQMLVDGLRESGWEASASTELPDALQQLRSGRYGLLVSDVHLGAGDGFLLLEAARDERRPVPVILMCSYGSERAVREALAAGAYAYLTKPFPLDELLALVARAAG